MAEVRINDTHSTVDDTADVDMTQGEGTGEEGAPEAGAGDTSELQEVAPPEEEPPARTTFVEYVLSFLPSHHSLFHKY